jgi:hypothetical protein
MFKKAMLVVSILALPIFVVEGHAQIVGDLEVDIPFQFHAGNARLPAGKYRIHMLDNSDLTLMEISSADGSSSALFEVQAATADQVPAQSELIFNKYGSRYFLATVFDEGNQNGSQVVESRYEKRIGRENKSAEQQHVSARHGQ